MCFFFFFLIRVWIFCHMSHVTKHTYPHTHMLTYKGTYKHPSPLSCLIITFLPFLYRGTPFCLLAQLLHAKPEGQRSALFITTVIQQRCLLPSGFTVTVAVSAVWPPDPMGESHQTLRFLQDVLRDQRAAAHTTVPSYIPSTPLLRNRPLKSFNTWEPTSKTTVFYWG